jgi:hypothetical protein
MENGLSASRPRRVCHKEETLRWCRQKRTAEHGKMPSLRIKKQLLQFHLVDRRDLGSGFPLAKK